MNLEEIPIHENSPDTINVIVEIPKGTSAKYEYDPELEIFRLDRCLPSSMKYPCSYGFIPSTIGEDKDPLDVLVYNELPVERGTLVECNVIGVLDMEDEGGRDWKILAVPTHHYKNYSNIEDVDQMFIKVAQYFFKHYKDIANKKVTIAGWKTVHDAKKVIKEGESRFQKEH